MPMDFGARRRAGGSRRARCGGRRGRPEAIVAVADPPTVDENRSARLRGVLHDGGARAVARQRTLSTVSNAESRKMVDTMYVKKRIDAEGGVPPTSTPAEYAAHIDKEQKKWGRRREARFEGRVT